MAYSTITKPSLHFNTVLYSGNSSTNNITGVGFQPDWLWIKARNYGENHVLYDAIRGVTKQLYSNTSGSESTNATALTAFASDGFNLATSNGNTNVNVTNFVSWNWKANGSGSANTDGSITSTVSANTTAGFSIVKFTANGSNNDGIGHGLGVAPKIIIYKRTDSTGPWYWVYKYVDGTLDYLILNDTNVKADLTLGTYGFSTSTTFTNLGFGNTHNMIAYCFAEKTGYSKFGSYVGNGNADGTFVYTGFKPAFVLVKNTQQAADNWFIWDNKRPGYNQIQKYLRANLNNAEADSSSFAIDILSNGFKVRASTGAINNNGETMIYMAFAEEPLVANVGSGIPATAR